MIKALRELATQVLAAMRRGEARTARGLLAGLSEEIGKLDVARFASADQSAFIQTRTAIRELAAQSNAQRFLQGVGQVERLLDQLERHLDDQELPANSQQATSSGPPDLQFMELAIEEARKSVGEDGRAHPKVGAVVVKDGNVLATAFRGELGEGEHAEYTALERKLTDSELAGATRDIRHHMCNSHFIHPSLDRLCLHLSWRLHQFLPDA